MLPNEVPRSTGVADQESDWHREGLKAALIELPPGWPAVEVTATTGSTNADLLARLTVGSARSLVDHGLLLVAEHQDAGRGRFDRTWSSPPSAGITASVVWRLAGCPRSRAGWIALLAGLGVVNAVRETAGVEAFLKWPNDIVVLGASGPNKLGGLLIEVAATGEYVVGLGLNVSTTAAELPSDAAVSLRSLGSSPVSREALVAAVARRWDDLLRVWEAAGWDPVVSGLARKVVSAMATIGTEVRVEFSPTHHLVGRAGGLDEFGRLLVEVAGESDPQAIAAGDVFHLRGRSESAEPR